ncbi:MAG: AlpA family phage regulatory protein [Synechococcus sp. MIT S9220]|nr:AlpA family phage regulatory protein [Synechococcus sp. MIT S9220]NOL47593.1 AlpA family phage regulatory protein [Synechococcus sp. MIT S9220]
MKPEVQLLRLPQIKEITCLSKSSLYLLMDEGEFLKQTSLGARSVARIHA